MHSILKFTAYTPFTFSVKSKKFSLTYLLRFKLLVKLLDEEKFNAGRVERFNSFTRKLINTEFNTTNELKLCFVLHLKLAVIRCLGEHGQPSINNSKTSTEIKTIISKIEKQHLIIILFWEGGVCVAL